MLTLFLVLTSLSHAAMEAKLGPARELSVTLTCPKGLALSFASVDGSTRLEAVCCPPGYSSYQATSGFDQATSSWCCDGTISAYALTSGYTCDGKDVKGRAPYTAEGGSASGDKCPYSLWYAGHECTGSETAHGRISLAECQNKCDALGSKCVAIDFGNSGRCTGDKCDCYTVPNCDQAKSPVSFDIWKRMCCPYREVGTSKECTGSETGHGRLTYDQCKAKCDALGGGCAAIDFGKGSKCDGDKCECYTVPACPSFSSNSNFNAFQRRCTSAAAAETVSENALARLYKAIERAVVLY